MIKRLTRGVSGRREDQNTPAVADRKDFVSLFGKRHRDHARDAHVVIAGEFALVLGRQKAAVRHLIDRDEELGRLDRVCCARARGNETRHYDQFVRVRELFQFLKTQESLGIMFTEK
jgi:hypothetical protein